MVSSYGRCPGSLVASIFGLSRFAQMDGKSLEGLHHVVRLCVDCIFGFTKGKFLCRLYRNQGRFANNCREVHPCWHWREPNSRWDWVRRECRCRTCSFWFPAVEGIGGCAYVEDMLSQFAIFECEGVTAFQFKFQYHCHSHIACEGSEQHCHLWVLGHGSLVDHNVSDVVVGKVKGFQADISMFMLACAKLLQVPSCVHIDVAIGVVEGVLQFPL